MNGCLLQQLQSFFKTPPECNFFLRFLVSLSIQGKQSSWVFFQAQSSRTCPSFPEFQASLAIQSVVSWEHSALFWYKFSYIPFFYCFSQFSFKMHPNFFKLVLLDNAIFPFLLNELTTVQPFKWQHFPRLACLQLIQQIWQLPVPAEFLQHSVQYLKSNSVYYIYNYIYVWK